MPIVATFTGGGLLPRVLSAVPITSTRLRVTFSESMTANGDLGDASNYTLSVVGPSTVRTITAVTLESSTTVLLDVSGAMSVGSPAYTLLVAAVVDLAGNVIDPLYDTVNVTVPSATLSVLQARAVDDRTLRVWLSTEPRHYSPSASDDALNRFNWSIGAQAGSVSAPVVEKPLRVFADAISGYAGAWAVDLAVDRALYAHGTYRVTAGASLRSADGTTVMALTPNNRSDGPGLAPRRPERPTRVLAREPLDIENDITTGRWKVTDQGGLSFHGGVAALRKRVLRRVVTSKGGFFHLPTFGAGIQGKLTIRPGTLATAQHQILRSAREEPDVALAEVAIARLATGAYKFSIKLKTRQGDSADLTGALPTG